MKHLILAVFLKRGLGGALLETPEITSTDSALRLKGAKEEEESSKRQNLA